MDAAKLFRLDGRVALVTGGSRNIGAWIAEGFIAQGAKVYISSRKADACFAMAEKLGPNCIALPQDVSTVAGCKALAAQLAEHETSLDILVNNAGAPHAAPALLTRMSSDISCSANCAASALQPATVDTSWGRAMQFGPSCSAIAKHASALREEI